MCEALKSIGLAITIFFGITSTSQAAFWSVGSTGLNGGTNNIATGAVKVYSAPTVLTNVNTSLVWTNVNGFRVQVPMTTTNVSTNFTAVLDVRVLSSIGIQTTFNSASAVSLTESWDLSSDQLTWNTNAFVFNVTQSGTTTNFIIGPYGWARLGNITNSLAAVTNLTVNPITKITP